ncbi:hypothetical protein M8845_01680 [Gelidibacter japonicus]|uniref:hypothetical protein n=1 Tax=Gelidibacter japonicus TaxID=1962232 RepID=UPI00201FDAC8|nr:hypothetical protein [Gelidibacter japonicus]MCL8006127.1 hypothetical protein [Gelidibacter japonicus]
MKQNPFSLYDFLGYLIPGATLIYLLIIIKSCGGDFGDCDLATLVSSVTEYQLQEVFFFIIASYALGHIISFLSSISIEKFGNWRYCYPSKVLIGFEKKSYWVLKQTPEDYNPDKDFYDIEPKQKIRSAQNRARGLLGIFILPLIISEYLLGQQLNLKKLYSKGLDPYLIDRIKERTIVLLNSLSFTDQPIKTNELKDIDFNRVVHHYAFENSKQHQFRMVNYVALYGFLRNLVLTFILSFWYYFAISLCSINTNLEFNGPMILTNIVLILLSFVAFMAYMKFYRRYTLEGLMLILVDKNIRKG